MASSGFILIYFPVVPTGKNRGRKRGCLKTLIKQAFHRGAVILRVMSLTPPKGIDTLLIYQIH